MVATRQAGYPSMHMRNTVIGTYVQDDWRVLKNLTFNLGVRYELVTPLHEVTKPLVNIDFVNGQPVVYIAGQSGYSDGIQDIDKNNFAPRVGFAYSPWNQRFVVRGGFGIFFGQGDMNTWCNQVHNVPVVFPETQQSDNFTPAITQIGFNPAVLGKTVTSFTGMDPHGRSAYTEQYSLTLEYQVTKSDMIQVAAAFAGRGHVVFGRWRISVFHFRIFRQAERRQPRSGKPGRFQHRFQCYSENNPDFLLWLRKRRKDHPLDISCGKYGQPRLLGDLSAFLVVLGVFCVLCIFVMRHLTDTTKTPRPQRAPRNTKSNAGYFHRSYSCSDAAPLRMKTASGCRDGSHPAGTLPHKRAFRAVTEGSGITQHEGQTSLPSRLLYSVLEKVSNRVHVPRSLRS